MDDKEVLRRMKNSYKLGKSTEEVTRSMLKKGYRLEYINLLNNRLKGMNKLVVILISLVLIFFLAFSASSSYVVYVILEPKNLEEKASVANPLDGVSVNFDAREVYVDEGENNFVSDIILPSNEVYVDDVEITPEFISYLLNELGVWQLKSNLITGSRPILNFMIEGDHFHSVVDDSVITTYNGLSSDSDVTLTSSREDIVRAMVSDNPANVFRNSFNEERSGLELDQSEAVLFAKGYLSLYDSLSS